MSLLPIVDKFLQSVVLSTVLTFYQKDAGLLIQVEMNFSDPTIYLLALGHRSAMKVTHWVS